MIFDEMAHYKLSHQDPHGLHFCYWFLTKTPICNNGFVQIQWWESLFQGWKGSFLSFFPPEKKKKNVSFIK